MTNPLKEAYGHIADALKQLTEARKQNAPGPLLQAQDLLLQAKHLIHQAHRERQEQLEQDHDYPFPRSQCGESRDWRGPPDQW